MPENTELFSLDSLQQDFLADTPNADALSFPDAPPRPADTLPGTEEFKQDSHLQAGETPYYESPEPENAYAFPQEAETYEESEFSKPKPSRHLFRRFLMAFGMFVCTIALTAAACTDGRSAPQNFFGRAVYMAVCSEAEGSLPRGTFYILELGKEPYERGDTVLLTTNQVQGTTRVIAAVFYSGESGPTYELEGAAAGPRTAQNKDIYGRVGYTLPNAGYAVSLLTDYRPYIILAAAGLLVFLVCTRIAMRTRRKSRAGYP